MQLGIVLVGLLLIASVSALFTYIGVRDHDQDYVGMEIIDRQRELLQQQSWLAVADPQNQEFVSAATEFQENLWILRSSGKIDGSSEGAQTIPATQDPIVQAEWESTSASWQHFRVDAQALWSLPLTDSNRNEAIRAVRNSMPILSDDLAELHEIYDQHMEADIRNLRERQLAALLCAIPLLIWGYIIIRPRIVRPTTVITAPAQPTRLQKPAQHELPDVYDDDLGQLLQSFVITRPEINAANKWVESQISQRTQLLMSTFWLSQEIIGQQELNQLLKLTTDKAMLLMGAHSAAMCLYESESTYLELISAQGQVATSIGINTEPAAGHPIQLINLADDPDGTGCTSCTFHQACGSANSLSTPLQAGNKQIGSLCVVREQDKPFNSNDQRALGLFGNMAAVAIRNAQLTQSSRYSNQQSAILSERKRLTAEIHDNLAQTLSYLNLRVERATQLIAATDNERAVAEIERIRSATHSAYDQVRSVLNNLHESESPANTQVIETITTFCADFRQVTGLSVDLDVSEAEIEQLEPLEQAQILNIIREALTNVHRHAKATHVSVRAWRAQESVCFVIADDGIGFDRANLQRQDSFGIAIMQARAERIGGNLTISSEVGKGTIVTAFVPLNAVRRLTMVDSNRFHGKRIAAGAFPENFV